MFQSPWTRHTSRRTIARPASRYRLRLETLENREMLTASLQTALSLATESGDAIHTDVVHDNTGNTFISGRLSSDVSTEPAGPMDFDPLNAYADDRDIITAQQNTSFIAKYNAAGEFAWVRASSGNSTKISSLAIGASGDVYFSGTHSGLMAFANMSAAGAGSGRDNRFAGRIDTSGNGVWLKSMDLAAIEFDTAGLAVDEAHNRVYLAGTQMLTNPGSRDAIVVALNTSNATNVTLAWTATLVATSSQYSPAEARDIAVDTTGAVYVGGSFQGSADFDPGSGKQNISSGSGGRFDIPTAGYVWKLTPTGGLSWAKVFSGSRDGGAIVSQVEVDAANSVAVAGVFSGTVDLDPGKATLNVTSNGQDAFLAKFGGTGNLVYAKGLISAGNESLDSLDLDAAGNIYLAGQRSGNAQDGAFIVKYNAAGTLQTQVLLLGAGITAPRLSFNRFTGTLHVIATFTGPVDLNGDGIVDLVSSVSEATDLFWATYGI